MFDFHFVYSDGNTYDIKNVNKILVQAAAGMKEIVGKNILSAYIPLKTMSLYTDNANITVSGTNLMVIDIVEQKKLIAGDNLYGNFHHAIRIALFDFF